MVYLPAQPALETPQQRCTACVSIYMIMRVWQVQKLIVLSADLVQQAGSLFYQLTSFLRQSLLKLVHLSVFLSLSLSAPSFPLQWLSMGFGFTIKRTVNALPRE